MRQKDVFMQSEADAWYLRNREAVLKKEKNFEHEDSVIGAIVDILRQRATDIGTLKILEVGCGSARRLAWLEKNLPVEVYGIEPSQLAVDQASAEGLKVVRGTADVLPYADSTFDIVIYGFCLYLCDRQDLFQIAREADRVLKANAWLVINDFFATTPVRREYKHKPGVFSYKMDYRKLFDWNPAYTCFSHQVSQHGDRMFTDDVDEWVATSIVRKKTH